MRELRFSNQRDMAEVEQQPADLDQDLSQAADRSAALRLSRALSRRELGDQVDETATSSEAVARDGVSGKGSEVPYRAEMEARLGMSLGGVKAHTGPEAEAASAALGAQAFTLGKDVAFRDTSPSRATVAHELTHVAQQATRGAGSVDADEREARNVAAGGSMVGIDVRPAAMTVEPASPALRMLRDGESSEGELAPPPDPALAKPPPTLDEAQVASAIKYDNGHWQDPHRGQILAYLRKSETSVEGAEFERQDVLAIARFQAESGAEGKDVDGKLGKATAATMLGKGLELGAVKVKPSQVRLVFYPGEFEDIAAWQKAKADAAGASNEYRAASRNAPPGHGTIYVEVGGNVVDRIDARGGPPVSLQDGTHTADPSRAGTYNLGTPKSHVTSSWMYSQIAWGAPIREQDGEIQFKNPGAAWAYATGDQCKLKHPFTKGDFYNPDGSLMTEWRLNDFGETALRVEGSPGLFVHTTPQSEEAQELGEKLELSHSHGCLHVHPEDRDRLMSLGYMAKGVTLVIKKYDESLDLGATN